MRKVVLTIAIFATLIFADVDIWVDGGAKSKSVINSVTVYADRALVERTGKVSLKAGDGKIFIGYLPQQIDRNSVRISVKTSGDVKLGGIEVFFERYEPQIIKALRDSIKMFEDKLDELKVEEQGLQTKQKFLESIANLGGGSAKDKFLVISPQNFSPTIKFISVEFSKLAREKTALNQKRRQIKKKLDELKERLNNMTGGRAGRGYRVEVPYNAKSSAAAKVTVKYVVFNCSWRPKYDARYDEETGKVYLTYYGVISQRTGEDWENVLLTLSTATPHMGIEPPELDIWYIRLFRPRPIARYKGGKAMALAAAPKQEVAEEAMFETATPEITGETVIFKIGGRTTIPADGQDHTTIIAQLNLDAKKKFVTVPRKDERVFLTALCKNKSDYLFLPGKVSVFQGNEFVGMKIFDTPIGFGEEFELALGAVRTIRVSHKRVREYTEKAGFIGKYKREWFAYETKLENNCKKEVTVEVRDHIPVAAQSEIKVEDVKFVPEPQQRDKHFTGEVIWSIKLAPGDKKTIRMEFSVKYPKNSHIIGI